MEGKHTKTITLFGSPGAGKTTQIDMLRDSGLDFEMLNVGRMLRKIAEEDSMIGEKVRKEMASGGMVDSDFVTEMVGRALDEISGDTLILLDAYPRTLHDVHAMEEMFAKKGLSLPLVICIKITREEAIDRLTHRRVCSRCKMSFDVRDLTDTEHCPECGGDLVHRDDDQLAAIEERFALFDMQDSIMQHYFANKGLYVEIDGMKSAEEVHEKLFKAISNYSNI